jgi:hypothetical protein
MVVSSGYFANSPAELKSIAVGGGMTMADANGVLTLSSTTPAATGPLYVTNNLIDLNYGWGLTLSSDGTHQLIVDTGSVHPLLSFSAPMVKSNNSVSLSYGSGLSLSNGTLIVDTSTIEPYFAPRMPLSLSGTGTAKLLKLWPFSIGAISIHLKGGKLSLICGVSLPRFGGLMKYAPQSRPRNKKLPLRPDNAARAWRH